MINGGFGFQLAEKMNLSSRSGKIAYSVVAGVVWVAWVAASIVGEMRRGKAEPPKYTESSRNTSVARDANVHPGDGHYAPK